MSVIFSDDFNRANSVTVDATNWTEFPSDAWAIDTNELRSTSPAASPATCITTTTAHAAIADCEVSITHATNTSFDGGPVARVTDSGTPDATPTLYVNDCYTGTMEVYRHNNSGTGTLIGTGQAITLAAGTVQKLKVVGTGATVTLDASYGATTKQVTDSSPDRLTAAGQTGVLNWAAATNDWDTFSVDDLAGGATPAPRRVPIIGGGIF